MLGTLLHARGQAFTRMTQSRKLDHTEHTDDTRVTGHPGPGMAMHGGRQLARETDINMIWGDLLRVKDQQKVRCYLSCCITVNVHCIWWLYPLLALEQTSSNYPTAVQDEQLYSMANSSSQDLHMCVYIISQPGQNALCYNYCVTRGYTTGFNLLIAAALIAESNTNWSIRVILINLLFSGVVSICQLRSSFMTVEEQFMISANRPWWQIIILIFYFGGGSQALFVTMYTVIMFLLVRF